MEEEKQQRDGGGGGGLAFFTRLTRQKLSKPVRPYQGREIIVCICVCVTEILLVRAYTHAHFACMCVLAYTLLLRLPNEILMGDVGSAGAGLTGGGLAVVLEV